MSYDFVVYPSIWRHYKTKAFKDLMKVSDDLTEIILKYVDEAMENLKNQKPTEDHEESVLEKLLKINKNLAVVMCIDSLMAGVDTTSSAYQTTLYCLAKNPEKQQRLRDELIKILPSKDDRMTVDNMRNLPYLRAVIKEGLRHYPPTVGSARKIDHDLVLSGYKVPKGTEIAIATMVTSQQEKHFAKSKEFIPERWMKDSTDPQCPHAKDSHPFSYLPFGFGSRACIGKRIAELELEVILAKTICNFNVEWNQPDIKIKGVLTNYPESDMKFKLTDL
jgi:cytochrome P450 family 12